MRFIRLVSELNGALYCNKANTSFVVEYMSRHRMATLSVNNNLSDVDVNTKGADFLDWVWEQMFY